jgi:hypothetical protein
MIPDKNLRNVVDDLAHTPVNGQEAQQLQQKTNDRRHEDLNHRNKHKNSGGDGTDAKD